MTRDEQRHVAGLPFKEPKIKLPDTSGSLFLFSRWAPMILWVASTGASAAAPRQGYPLHAVPLARLAIHRPDQEIRKSILQIIRSIPFWARRASFAAPWTTSVPPSAVQSVDSLNGGMFLALDRDDARVARVDAQDRAAHRLPAGDDDLAAAPPKYPPHLGIFSRRELPPPRRRSDKSVSQNLHVRVRPARAGPEIHRGARNGPTPVCIPHPAGLSSFLHGNLLDGRLHAVSQPLARNVRLAIAAGAPIRVRCRICG